MEERDSSSAVWTVPKPMLAYGKPPGLLLDEYGALGWIAEPKLDGIRLTVRRRNGAVLAMTRPGPGRPDGKVRRLPAAVGAAIGQLPDGVYDGELAVAGGASWDVAAGETDDDKTFFVFDVLETLDQELVRMPLSARRGILELAVQAVQSPLVQLVPRIPATEIAYGEVLAAGGEGVMLKRPESVYRPGARTKEWLKVKPTCRATFTIDGYEPAIRGPHATLRLTDREHNEITVGTPGPVLAIANRVPHTLIGRQVIVKYQMRTEPSDRCPTGSYRHPRLDADQTFALWRSR